MKMYEIIRLPNLLTKLKTYNLPIRTSYKFTKLANIVESELLIYQEHFGKIIEEYGKKDENGNYVFSPDGATIAIIPGKEEECQAKLNELQNIEINTSNISFSLEELEGLELSILDLQTLFSLIIE